MSDASFAVIATHEVVETGFLRLERLEVRAPDGSTVLREVVRHPGAVAMVPVVGDSVVLIRQYRAPVDAYVLELPAGKLDIAGEDPALAAHRELEEEIGYRAGLLEPIATFWTGPGFTDERMTVYLATECEPVEHSPHGPEEENAEVVHIPVADLPAMLGDDRFEDAKTIVGLQAMLQRR